MGTIKTILGIDAADIKTINGIDIADIATRNGQDIPSGGGGNEPYTQDFIDAWGLSDATIIAAMNDFEAGLTSDGEIDHSNPSNNKWYAIYLTVGGSVGFHKINFLNPADTDGAYRATFSGTWTHSATGIQANGTDTLAQSHFNALTVWGAGTNACMFFRSRTSGNSLYDMSFGPSGGGNALIARLGGNAYAAWTSGSYGVTATNADGSGTYVLNHNGSSLTELLKNGVVISSATESGFPANSEIYLGGVNGESQFSNREFTVWGIGKSHSNAEHLAFHNRLVTFDTALSR